MKKIILIATLFLITSCGLKVIKSDSPEAQPKPSKPGITLGEGGIGQIEVQRVGYECTVHAGIMYYSATGGNEAEATKYAVQRCRAINPSGSCDQPTCKHL